MTNVNAEAKAFVERVCNLLEQRQEVNEDIKQVVAEAKAAGYTPATIRKAASRAMKDRRDVITADSELLALEAAMGMDMPNW